MRHIEVLFFGQPPCDGEVIEQDMDVDRDKDRAPQRRDGRHALQVLGGAQRPQRAWICAACGKRWEREPTLSEAL